LDPPFACTDRLLLLLLINKNRGLFTWRVKQFICFPEEEAAFHSLENSNEYVLIDTVCALPLQLVWWEQKICNSSSSSIKLHANKRQQCNPWYRFLLDKSAVNLKKIKICRYIHVNLKKNKSAVTYTTSTFVLFFVLVFRKIWRSAVQCLAVVVY